MSDRRNARRVIKSSSGLPMTVIVHPHARHPVLRLPVLGALVGVLLLAGLALKVAELRADTARYDEAAASTMHGEADGIRRAGPPRPAPGAASAASSSASSPAAPGPPAPRSSTTASASSPRGPRLFRSAAPSAIPSSRRS